MITDNFSDKVKSVSVYKDNKFSDHAPLIINYDIWFDKRYFKAILR